MNKQEKPRDLAPNEIESTNRFSSAEKILIRLILINKVRFGIMRRISNVAIGDGDAPAIKVNEVARGNIAYNKMADDQTEVTKGLAGELSISPNRLKALYDYVVENESRW